MGFVWMEHQSVRTHPSTHTGQRRFRFLPTATQHHGVIGVTQHHQPGFPHFYVKLVKVNIGEQRADYRPLRTAILFKAAAETLLTLAADPKHLGARIGATLVLHTWGSAMTHHPHVHGIVPGGGLSLDGQRWVACREGFFLPVRVLSRLFRRLFLEQLSDAHRAGKLQFFGEHQALAETKSFTDWLKPLRQIEWVVYAKRPFAGPEAVLAYLSRYTHRVAIANSRLIALDEQGVTFKWKDYRAREQDRHKTLTLAPGEFMRRFLLHVLPAGLHRIRHYGLFANIGRKHHLAKIRELLVQDKTDEPVDAEANTGDTADSSNRDASAIYVCPDCGAAMIIIETFERGQLPRAPPSRIDAS